MTTLDDVNWYRLPELQPLRDAGGRDLVVRAPAAWLWNRTGPLALAVRFRDAGEVALRPAVEARDDPTPFVADAGLSKSSAATDRADIAAIAAIAANAAPHQYRLRGTLAGAATELRIAASDAWIEVDLADSPGPA